MTSTDILPAVFWNADPCPPSAAHWTSWKDSFFEYLNKLADIHPDAVIDESTRLILFRMNLGKQGQKYFDTFNFRQLGSLREAFDVLERLLGYVPALECSSDEEPDDVDFFPYLPVQTDLIPQADISKTDHDDCQADECPVVHEHEISHEDLPNSDDCNLSVSLDEFSIADEVPCETVSVSTLCIPVLPATHERLTDPPPKRLVRRTFETYENLSENMCSNRNFINRPFGKGRKRDHILYELSNSRTVITLFRFSIGEAIAA